MQGAREVRITSLDRFEAADGGVRVLANSGDLALVFPREVWETLGERALLEEAPSEPDAGELAELEEIRRGLEEHARSNRFETVLVDEPCGGENSGVHFDLVLRPADPFAATTGYAFLPVVRTEHVARYGANLDEATAGAVEGAYLVGAVAEEAALAAGGEELKALSVRGRRCSSSRFELAPELWRVLSGDLGWKNVEPVVSATTNSTTKRNA